MLRPYRIILPPHSWVLHRGHLFSIISIFHMHCRMIGKGSSTLRPNFLPLSATALAWANWSVHMQTCVQHLLYPCAWQAPSFKGTLITASRNRLLAVMSDCRSKVLSAPGRLLSTNANWTRKMIFSKAEDDELDHDLYRELTSCLEFIINRCRSSCGSVIKARTKRRLLLYLQQPWVHLLKYSCPWFALLIKQNEQEVGIFWCSQTTGTLL